MNIDPKISVSCGVLAVILFCLWGEPAEGKKSKKIDALLLQEGSKLSLQMKQEISKTILSVAEEYQVDPILILAIMEVESQFDPKAISNRGALGLMQIRPIVVRDVAEELGIDPTSHHQLLTSHEFNIRVGVHYLSNLLKRFGGDVQKALMAYNRGPTAVAKTYKNRPVPSNGYQGKVLKAFQKFSSL